MPPLLAQIPAELVDLDCGAGVDSAVVQRRMPWTELQ
jgi:hypothetical protein